MLLALSASLLGSVQAGAALQPTSGSGDPLATVLAAARSHVGAPYQFGGTGPSFDCSGLVYRVFKDSGELKRIGGSRRTAASLLRWFRRHGHESPNGGMSGDLVIYAGGSHVGIYLGHGRVVSAVIHGVRKHGLHRLTIPFTTFLHTRLSTVQPVTPAARLRVPGSSP